MSRGERSPYREHTRPRRSYQGRPLPRRHPVQGRPLPRPGALRAAVPLAPVAGRGARGVRDELGGQLALDRGEDRAAGPGGRGRHRSGAAHAGHRLLRAHRLGAAHRARHEAGRGRRPDAAAVLLQGRLRRRPLPELRGGDRAGGRPAAAPVRLPHPAGVPGADHARADRAAAQGLPGHRGGREGQLGRLEQHQGDAGRLRGRRLRRLRGQRDLPARQHARQAAPAASAPPPT